MSGVDASQITVHAVDISSPMVKTVLSNNSAKTDHAPTMPKTTGSTHGHTFEQPGCSTTNTTPAKEIECTYTR